MEWKSVPREEARRIIAVGMRCRLAGEGLRISAVSECLRTMSYLCSVSADGNRGWEAVASIRLSGMVRRRLAPLWPEIADNGEDTCPGVMTVLNSLDELGDMVRLKGGRWLTAPAHAVRAGDGMAVLLGGGPTEVLPQAVAARVAGRVRLIEQATCDGWVDLWEADEWIGAPLEGLDVWSKRLLVEASTRLTDAPNDMGEVSAYLRRKWIRLSDLATNEGNILLCRTLVGQGVSYFIGEFVRGRLRRLSSIALSDDVRRLRFYLDAQTNFSMRVDVVRSAGLAKLRLVRRLPEREARVLLLGWQVPGREGEHPGVTHHVFPEETIPIVRKVFEGLGIVMDERMSARRKVYEREI